MKYRIHTTALPKALQVDDWTTAVITAQWIEEDHGTLARIEDETGAMHDCDGVALGTHKTLMGEL